MKIDLMDGPIPGENFTSDTKNYPWHRAPEFDDMDDAIEASFKKLSTEEGAFSLLTALDSGISVVDMASIFVINGVGSGKWTPDFAILLAGPVAHMMQILADGYGLKYEMGLDDKKPKTSAVYHGLKGIDRGAPMREAIESLEEQVDDVKNEADTQSTGGFMSPPDKETI